MKKHVAVLMIVAFANSYAFAGVIDFGPAQDVVVGAPDMTVTFPVTISSSFLTSINSVRVIMESSDLVLAPPSGTIAPGDADPSLGSAFTADGRLGFPGVPDPFSPEGFLGGFDQAFIDLNGTSIGNGINFAVVNTGGRDPFGIGTDTPILIGHLTVDAAGLDIGAHTVDVRGGSSTIGNPEAVFDDLFGVGTVNVTPEPATLVLLGIGGVAAAFRRRRTA